MDGTDIKLNVTVSDDTIASESATITDSTLTPNAIAGVAADSNGDVVIDISGYVTGDVVTYTVTTTSGLTDTKTYTVD